jgi:hypothetical protein
MKPDIAGISDVEVTMKLSARNILSAKVVAVTKGATTAHVKIELCK